MPTKKIRIIKNKLTGEVRTVYSDDVAPFLAAIGDVQVCRATDVEPQIIAGKVAWRAELRQAGGITVALTNTRQEAIDTEVEFLNKNVLPNSERFEEIFNG